ncbi:DNA-3-methyladenine glycosylase [Candidatus Saccharibacteria bacterium QS_5_54_17]|nr:MAG: DNA-3-methyladenine glycosylase [Candidatus Saccharibacteria bacterium QS_5_54_17]
MHRKHLCELKVDEAARALLGQQLVRILTDGSRLKGKIVETEAYHETDPAAHTYNGKTDRNAVMIGPAGYAYVYFVYGMHYCLNVVTGPEGTGEAVLIRALEPKEGMDVMQQNRSLQAKTPGNMCSGPAKLTQALAIDRQFNGHDLRSSPLYLKEGKPVADTHITRSTRVGVRSGASTPWRFYIKGNAFISKP